MFRAICGMGVALILLAVTATLNTPARAEVACTTPLQVSIDIKPGSFPNSINLSSRGIIPVALLSSATFDATQFVPEMAHLSDASTGMSCAGAMAVSWTKRDVNGDALQDLLFKFQTADLDLTPNSTAANFMAHGTYAGTPLHLMGSDSVRITK